MVTLVWLPPLARLITLRTNYFQCRRATFRLVPVFCIDFRVVIPDKQHCQPQSLFSCTVTGMISSQSFPPTCAHRFSEIKLIRTCLFLHSLFERQQFSYLEQKTHQQLNGTTDQKCAFSLASLTDGDNLVTEMLKRN